MAFALLKHTLHNLVAEDAAEQTATFRVRYCPVGIVGLITPWNNPLAIPIGKLAPALAYGNAVVWKPALQAPQLSRLVMQCLAESGLGDAVALVTGDADTGRALLEQKDIAAISFTGSITVGRRVATVCAAQGKALQAELGGNNAAIIMADADMERVAQVLAPSMFSFSGQRCTAIRRLIADAHPDSPLVQEESFGPIAVITAADNIDHALSLNNAVPHGLLTAVFSDDTKIQQRVMKEAQSGIIAINQYSLNIDPSAPFGGWKASGIGLPEHGLWDKAFYTKAQAVYGI